MAGFDNDIVYGENVDFSGSSSVSGQVTADGQLLIGSTASPYIKVNTLTAGAGISIANGSGSIQITATTTAFAWNEETGTSANMAVENGYVANNGSLVTLTLPATASVGDTLKIVAKGAGLVKIAQNASQVIHWLSSDTTSGTGGSITATQQWGSVELVCVTDDTDWAVADAMGSWTIV